MRTRIFLVAAILSLFSLKIHATPAPEKDWNLLVFVNGINDLDQFGAININQMEEVGSNQNMNILVQWGSMASTSVKRLLVQKDNQPQVVTSPVVEDMGNVDMGDYRQVTDFVAWAHENYPAKHYYVVIWNHGSGWHPAFASTRIRMTNISYDERSGHSIDTIQLAQTMRDSAAIIGHKVDIYASDACLMGMIEIATEMADSVEYFIGSQDLEPGEGWSYATILRSWQANMSAPARWIAQMTSQDFKRAYSKGGVYQEESVTMSVFDMSKIDGIIQSLKNIATELSNMAPAELALAKTTAKSSKSFSESDYVDLKNFLDSAGTLNGKFQVDQQFTQAFNDFVISNDQTQDLVTFGMSIWLPITEGDYNQYAGIYHDLAFDKITNWSGFLSRMHGVAIPAKH